MKLFDYQQKGVDFLLSRGRGLLCDEMGLGKGAQVIHSVLKIGAGNVLIVCPASLRLMWEAEIKKWIEPAPQVVVLDGKSKQEQLAGKLRFVVVSYNYLQKQTNVERLRRIDWAVVVADEAHSIKTWSSKTCQGFVRVVGRSRCWMLTGTPATVGAADYYPYLKLIEPDKWGEFEFFQKKFCNVKEFWLERYDKVSRRKVKKLVKTFTGWNEKTLPILQQALSQHSLRRLKKTVLPQLPPIIIQEIPVLVDSEIVAECLTMDMNLIKRILESGGVIPGHIGQVCRSIGASKISAAVEWLSGIDEPIVVFTKHRDVAEELSIKLKNKRVGKITGAENSLEKDQAVKAFQCGELDVVIVNVQAGGVGITLTKASHCLFVELDWSYAVMSQCIGRLHRIGQEECVNVYLMVGSKTVDELVMKTLNYKERLMREVFG